MKKILTLIAVGLAVFISTPIQAEPLKITITSNSKDERISTVLPTDVRIIDEEDIASLAASSIGNLLATSAGVQIIDAGAGEAIALRGFSAGSTGNNILVLVNGRRLNNNDISSPDLSSIALQTIQRIEIIRGSAAVLYGDNAVGGVVNIITSDHNIASDSDLLGSLSFGLGSYNAQTLTANVQQHNDAGLSLSAVISDRLSDGYRDYNASKQTNGRLRLEYQPQSLRVYAEVENNQEERDLPSGLNAVELEANRTQVLDSFNTDFQDRETDVMCVGIEDALIENWLYKVDVFDRQATENAQTSGRSFAGLPYETQRNHQGLSSRLLGNIATRNGKMQIIAGMDLEASEIAFDWGRENQQKVNSLFFNVDFPLSEKFVATVGTRASQVEDDLLDPFVYASGVVIENDVAASEVALSYQNNDMRYYARLAESFRLPKVDEQAYTSPDVAGLAPQSGLSQELGFELRQDKQTLSLSAYVLALEDEIVFDSTATMPVGGFFPGANVNADASTRQGLNLRYEYRLPRMAMGGSADWTDATFDSGLNAGNDVPFVADSRLSIYFKHTLSPKLNYRFTALRLGEMFAVNDEANALQKVPAYTVVDASVLLKVNQWQHTFTLNNILNEEYNTYVAADFAGDLIYTPASGQNFQFNTSYQF